MRCQRYLSVFFLPIVISLFIKDHSLKDNVILQVDNAGAVTGVKPHRAESAIKANNRGGQYKVGIPLKVSRHMVGIPLMVSRQQQATQTIKQANNATQDGKQLAKVTIAKDAGFIDVFQKNTHGFSREMNFDPYLGFVTLKS